MRFPIAPSTPRTSPPFFKLKTLSNNDWDLGFIFLVFS